MRNRTARTTAWGILLTALCAAGLLLGLRPWRLAPPAPAPLVGLAGTFVGGTPHSAEPDAVRILTAKGTPIYALADGVVSCEGEMGMLYSLAFPAHGARVVLLAPHVDISLVDKQTFRRGEIIGYVADGGLLSPDAEISLCVFGGGQPTDYLRLTAEGQRLRSA